MIRIVIVGGGMAGLSAAWELVRGGPHAGYSVTILESTARIGGALRQAVVAGRSIDVGAEALLATRPEARALIEEIGAAGDLVAPATTSAAIYSYGALHPLPRGTLLGIPRDPSSVAGILAPAEVARLAAERTPPPPIGDVGVGDYIGAALGDAVVDRLVEPLLGGVYAGHARRLSLAATMPSVYAAARAGESVLGLAAGGGAPGAGVGSSAVGSPFLGLRGGVGRLPDLLGAAVREAGGTIRTGATVRSLRHTGGGWELVIGPTIAAEVVEADAVVVATPPAAARRLLAGVAPDASAALGEIATASMAIVTLAFRRSEVAEVVGSGFLVPPVEGRTIKASTFSSAKWGWLREAVPDVAFVRASIGRAGEEATLQRPDATLVDVVRRDLAGILGELPVPIDTHVQRWGGALPQYAVGHRERVERIRADVARWRGLEVAGAAYEGVGVPAVIGSGRAAGRASAREWSLED